MDTPTMDRHSALSELVAIALTQSGVAVDSGDANRPTLDLPGWSLAVSIANDETPDAALRRAENFDDGGTALPAVVSYSPGRELQEQHVTMSLGTFGKLVQRLPERP
ncbi:hypothetical protein CLV49_3281 [Labedella gwakjiensis]|uniref:Uncharacterized protein n=1 Tax=Labedella gwakjiensis TaxID=390269 RepID=A0A2P8H080_9MICO|nr:hypothetical protein [Labedella gwakjiensis]PSL39637.1 hypothetical protein CLV49_3281 [Labedella gwakjiensis]RUQ85974.1 hypothetical protein ELQ93_02855 [Labedella gwakjiensis]